MKASILAIGTELTTGQITNRNASWISERLVNLGIEVVLHETVADDREMIARALDRCSEVGGLVFVTGGLGPTTDDFTREVIAKWLKKSLEFYEPSWTKITTRLSRLGIPVAESNRQQCFFPQGAQVIVNREGTADAFSAENGATRLWVLPGPPREVTSAWETIEAELKNLFPAAKPLKLLTWQCIGKSEAELGELTERALKGSGLAIGYRAHRPYVEIKVWCPENDIKNHAQYFETLERAIGPWIATKQGADLAAILLGRLERAQEVEIFDAATGGILAERIGNLLRKTLNAPLEEESDRTTVSMAIEWNTPSDPKAWVENTLSSADHEALTLALAGFKPNGEWEIGMLAEGSVRIETLQSPYTAPELLDRSQRYTAELALLRWSEWLRVKEQ